MGIAEQQRAADGGQIPRTLGPRVCGRDHAGRGPNTILRVGAIEPAPKADVQREGT